MKRSELLSKLQALGMSFEAEQQLKKLLQCEVAGHKATTARRQRQQEHRWQKVGLPCMGVGFDWLQVAIRKGWIK